MELLKHNRGLKDLLKKNVIRQHYAKKFSAQNIINTVLKCFISQ